MSPATDHIHLSGLSKGFSTPEGRVQAVCDLTLAIGRGETIALLGPNGAGKSTTIDLLLGLTRPDAGTVSLFGRPPQQAIAEGAIGAMLQTGELLRDLTVRELISMLCALYPRPLPVDEVIALTGLERVAERRTQRLSGGETQRVRFALAVAPDPEVLVLDEPTVAMDVEGRRAFWGTMRGLTGRGKTIVFATHYIEEADQFADRAVLMARGRVVADGPTTEIKAMVGGRIITATLPGVPVAALERLPGATGAERRGEAVSVRCEDSDLALRALLGRFAAARDIEVRGGGLEEAFVQLTSDPPDGANIAPPATRELAGNPA